MIFLGICASMDCFMLSNENPCRLSELKRGSVSVSMENDEKNDDDESAVASPFSAARC